jgi:hypothetical protein
MDIRKVISRRIRRQGKNVDVVGDINAVISANVGERGSVTRTSSKQRIVQRSQSTASRRSSRKEGGPDDEAGS